MTEIAIKLAMACEKCDSYIVICPVCGADKFFVVRNDGMIEIHCEQMCDGCGWFWNADSPCPKCNDGKIYCIKEI